MADQDVGHGDSQAESDDDRWHGRPVLAALITAGVYLAPILFSVLCATATAHVLARPHGAAETLGWWAVVLGVPTVVLVATDRIARKALPLAVLLKMTMVFPDRAPKRMAVARKAGSTRDLARRVENAKTHGVEDEPVRAAEKILALAGALNAHDRLTRGHGERVRAYTDLIADELDLALPDRDRLRWSALLHDIGKLAVHPHILNKPASLSDEEWETIKQHPLEGAKLTAPLASWLGEWANTIAEHHERFDGTGYPYGLTGQEISLGGRIVAVADCYDTMTAIRTYKKTMSPEEARTELAACAGTHFDPKVVRAFLDVSIGRLRPIAGPITWMGTLPFVGNVPRLGQVFSILGRAAAGFATVAGAVTAGIVSYPVQQASAVLHEALGHNDMGGSRSTSGADPTSPGLPGSQTSTGGTDLSSGGGRASAGSSHGGEGASGQGSGTESSIPGPGGSGSTHQGSGSAGGSSATSTPTGSVPVVVTTTTVSSTTSTAPPGPSSLAIRNGGAQAGRPQLGDQIIVTFSAPPSPASFCGGGWSGGAFPDLTNSNVVVHGLHGTGNDKVTLTDTADCGGGFHFGTIDLGQTGYFSGTANFGGPGGQCSGSQTSGCSRIHWDGVRTLTVTLGQESSGQPTQGHQSVGVYTPDPALGIPGTIASPLEVQF